MVAGGVDAQRRARRVPGRQGPAGRLRAARPAIAAKGYLVAIVEFPFNLAVLEIDAADAVLAAHPEIEAWAIGGHSLGGAMAAQYAGSHDAALDGLALWAAYPANDLAGAGLAATSIYGTLDAGAARMGGPETARLLPPDTVFVPIEGGNHRRCARSLRRDPEEDRAVPRCGTRGPARAAWTRGP